MLVRIKVLVEAKQLVLTRLTRLANNEKLNTIQEAARTAVVCTGIINQGLVTSEDYVCLYRSCAISKAGVLEPETTIAKKLEDNILHRLHDIEPLNYIQLSIVKASLLPVIRLFVEFGAFNQIGLNHSIVDHKVPVSPKKLVELRRLMERIDIKHWRLIHSQFGQDAIHSVSESMRKALRAEHRSAIEIGQQSDDV